VKPRLEYLDWVRGVAAVIMLQGHVFHSFLNPAGRVGASFQLSQFAGGMPPAIFLFLTGVTLAFLMHSGERRGESRRARVLGALRRAGYLMGLAFLFRLQLWLFIFPQSPWTDLLRVDILNSMGLAIALMSPAALVATATRVKICALAGMAIAAAAPLVSALDWSRAPVLLRSYIAPDYFSFGLFPWAAFVAFGLSVGSGLRLMRPEQVEGAVRWAALAGGLLILAGQHLAGPPYWFYPKTEFWLDHPALIAIKLGVILLILAFAFVWMRQCAGWSWVRQLGTTSLLVYWVHTELVYGRWLGVLKERLTAPQTVAAAAGVIFLMLGLSLAQTHRGRLREILAGFAARGWPERELGLSLRLRGSMSSPGPD